MGIFHRNIQRRVAENFLQGYDVTAIHNEMACKGVAQYMGHLSGWSNDTSPSKCRAESRITRKKKDFLKA